MKIRDESRDAAGSVDQDGLRIKILGEYWDEWYEPDANGKPGRLVSKSPVRKNLQMLRSLPLVAGLLKVHPGWQGLVYHAQGRGSIGWGATPPAPATSDTQLVDEIERRAPDSIVFLDALDVPTATPSEKLLVTTTYDLADLAGESIREQCLVGGDATGVINTGYVLNIMRHDLIYKSGALILVRKVKLTLST